MKKKLILIHRPLCLMVLLILSLSSCGTSDNGHTADINKNDTGKTVIKTISLDTTFPSNSYMIISKSGTVIVVDPYKAMDGIRPDAIVSTHSHPDHNDSDFYSKSNCKESLYTVESFSVKDVNISGIASTHLGNNVDKDFLSNVIYVFEVDGLRIAHMGDIGQDQLNDEQIKALGKIDIAFMQFVNEYSDYSNENEKGFKLIEQLKPQIIIPTHYDAEAVKKISGMVGKYESVDNSLIISKDDFKDGCRKVVEIKNTLNQSS